MVAALYAFSFEHEPHIIVWTCDGECAGRESGIAITKTRTGQENAK
jgi:hypothetical protein